VKKFLFLAHGPMDRSPEAQQAHRGWWLSIQDHVVDSGNPLVNGRDVAAGGEVTEIAADLEPATGYSLVQAESLEAAVALLRGCPMAMWVYEAMPM
jgi:hypothetical protein